jgi:hypothetical protein
MLAFLREVSGVRPWEWLSFAYFGRLGLMARVRPLPAGRRLTITAVGAVICAAIAGVAIAGPVVVRDWSPLAKRY